MNIFERAQSRLQEQKGIPRFSSGFEEFLTEQFAFFLDTDRLAARNIMENIMDKDDVQIDQILTEQSLQKGRVDLKIRFSEAPDLLIENKVDASLREDQLSDYLEERNSKVALITRKGLTIQKEVRDHDDYIQPDSGQPHFFWTDIYKMIRDAPDLPDDVRKLRDHFLDYMEVLEMAPSNLPDQWERLFASTTDPDNRRVREKFGRSLERSLLYLVDQGHEITTNSYSVKSIKPKTSDTLWRRVRVGPREVNLDEVDTDDKDTLRDLRESMAIYVSSRNENHEEFKSIHDNLPYTWEDPSGSNWYRMGPEKYTRDKFRVGMVRPLSTLFEGDENVTDLLETVVPPVVDMVMEKLPE